MDQQRSSPPREYPTRDLQLSAFLRARGHRLCRIDRTRHPRLLVFEWTPRIEDDARGYFADQPVGAQTLFDAYRALKHAMFEPV
jgi:hypothetical protein